VEQSPRKMQPDNVRSILLTELKEEQSKLTENSPKWTSLEKKIQNIIAQNYLEYMNR